MSDSAKKELTTVYDLGGLLDKNIHGAPVQALMNQGYIIDKDTGKIRAAIEGLLVDTPWIYTRSHPETNCILWFNIMFQVYNVLAEGCLHCYKVVVKPRTVEELFKLYDYQKDISKRACKCGIDPREYVFGNYGGYFYNRSLQEGLECFKEVREDVDKYISPDVPVSLKRGCTEFEARYGDSLTWEAVRSDAMQVKEKEIIENSDICNENKTFPETVIRNQHIKWLKYAWSVGDETCLNFNRDKPLYSQPRSYHVNNKKALDSIIKGGKEV